VHANGQPPEQRAADPLACADATPQASAFLLRWSQMEREARMQLDASIIEARQLVGQVSFVHKTSIVVVLHFKSGPL